MGGDGEDEKQRSYERKKRQYRAVYRKGVPYRKANKKKDE